MVPLVTTGYSLGDQTFVDHRPDAKFRQTSGNHPIPTHPKLRSAHKLVSSSLLSHFGINICTLSIRLIRLIIWNIMVILSMACKTGVEWTSITKSSHAIYWCICICLILNPQQSSQNMELSVCQGIMFWFICCRKCFPDVPRTLLYIVKYNIF